MNDRHAFNTVATEITGWQAAAQQLPLDELFQVVLDCQHDLAISLDAFNGVCTDPDDGGLPSAEATRAMGDVTRVATALAIFYLGISTRTRARLTAQQN
jgi:hypothetical protein